MVQRIVEELKCRGYNVWFGKSRATLIGLRQLFLRWLISTDIEMMKGSVIECMSAAIEGAVSAESRHALCSRADTHLCAQEVVLYGVCEAYKESANCVRPNHLALLHICAFESDETCLLQRMEAQYAMQRQVRYDLPLLALCAYALTGDLRWLRLT